ncbi:GSCOCG00009742001-RA-CDS, partial [Cotesia congregata]
MNKIELNNPPAVPLRRKKTSSNNKLLKSNLSPKQPIKNIIISSGASSSNKLIKEDNDKNLIKYSSNLNKKKLNIPVIKEPKIQEDKKLKIKNNPTLLFTTRDFESVMEHSDMNRVSHQLNSQKFQTKINNDGISEETTCFTITASNLPFATFKRELTNENFTLNKNKNQNGSFDFDCEKNNKFFHDLKIQNLENESKEFNYENKSVKNANKIDKKNHSKTPNQMKNDLLNELVTNFNELKLKKISIPSQVTDKNDSDKKVMVGKINNVNSNSNKNNNGINCVISMNNSACNIGKKTDDKDLEIDNYNNDTTSLKRMKKNNNPPILPAKIISNFTDDKISRLCINNNNNN